MTKPQFLGRLLLWIILPVTGFNVLVIELLIYFGQGATPAELPLMLYHPIPIIVILLTIYCSIVYFYSRPILRFLDSFGAKAALTDRQVQAVQERCVNLPYFCALFAFPSFVIGGAAGGWIIARNLGWPSDVIGYGFLGGLVAGLITVPMAIYAAHWVVEPILQQTVALLPESEAARLAGFRLSLRFKFNLILMVLVGAIAGYMVVLGYSQTHAVLKNMARMEELLPAAVQADLADQIQNSLDPRIRSSRFFQSRMGSLKTFYLTVWLVGLGLALLLGIAAARETTRPIRILQSVAEKVRRGDYGQPLRLVSNDELAELGAALNRMMGSIRGHVQAMESVVENLRQGIRRLEETVSTLHAISAEQATGATEQATAVEEASTVAEEIVATARHIAEGAGTVDGIAHSTLSACQEGEQKLAEVRDGFAGISEQVQAIGLAMQELEDRFQEIYRGVELMDEISDQTELLALNASLEAAGAGAAGQRFKVVAEATQRLAVRAADATREIRGLVETIQAATLQSHELAEKGRERVAAGATVIAETVSALKRISSLAETTSRSAGEITVSTRQQTQGSEQLAGSVAQVHAEAQRVEAGARQIQAAIAELQSFAEALRETVEGKGAVRADP